MSAKHPFSQLPAVQTVLREPDIAALEALFPAWAIVQAIRDELAALREKLAGESPRSGHGKWPVSAQHIRARAEGLCASPLQRVVNATGVVLHTNLGRAPLAKAVVSRLQDLAGGYLNLEYDLVSGERGHRQQHLHTVLQSLTGAEAHVVVNNNAAAVLLGLSALCAGKKVVVSRGELVEIGGSFRVPDVMRASGAILSEVGCTNKTHVSDYLHATDEHTAAYFKVHRANFAQVGFVQDVPLSVLSRAAHDRGLLCLYDLGAGALVPPLPRAKPGQTEQDKTEVFRSDQLGLWEDAEPTVAEAIAQGADVVMFSGDKLLGGPQAGVLCGKKDAIDRVAKHPLMRALRPDKLTLVALLVTLELYRDGKGAEIPTLRMLSQTEAELKTRAEALVSEFAQRNVSADLLRVQSAVGGGALPLAALPSFAVSPHLAPERLSSVQTVLRQGKPPVIARVFSGRLLFDVRTLEDADFPDLARVLAQALAQHPEHGS